MVFCRSIITHPLDWIYTNFINNGLINISIKLSFSVSPIFIFSQWVESGISPEALIVDGQAPLDASAFTVWTFMNIGDIHLSIQKLITTIGDSSFHQEPQIFLARKSLAR